MINLNRLQKKMQDPNWKPPKITDIEKQYEMTQTFEQTIRWRGFSPQDSSSPGEVFTKWEWENSKLHSKEKDCIPDPNLRGPWITKKKRV